jgi:hypothetical protein
MLGGLGRQRFLTYPPNGSIGPNTRKSRLFLWPHWSQDHRGSCEKVRLPFNPFSISRFRNTFCNFCPQTPSSPILIDADSRRSHRRKDFVPRRNRITAALHIMLPFPSFSARDGKIYQWSRFRCLIIATVQDSYLTSTECNHCMQSYVSKPECIYSSSPLSPTLIQITFSWIRNYIKKIHPHLDLSWNSTLWPSPSLL